MELRFESQMLSHGLVWLQRDTVADESWLFRIHSPLDIEDQCWEILKPEDVTKIAIARFVSVNDGSDWKNYDEYTKTVLSAAMASGDTALNIAVAKAKPAPAPKGKAGPKAAAKPKPAPAPKVAPMPGGKGKGRGLG